MRHEFVRLRVAAFFMAVLLLPTFSTAQAPVPATYDVELVIFRNLGGSTPEQWSMNDPVTESGDDAEAPDPSAAEAPFPKLPAERLKLNPIYDQLKRSRGYQPLAHLGWTQPATDRASTHYVSLNALGLDNGVSGRAALARGRYLHLTLDLALQIPGDGTRYVLKQTRRMRSTEMHYIDHPRFGIVALITPTKEG
ncbi:MAG: CsiV family protein [Steroidobacteraceae bacterium]